MLADGYKFDKDTWKNIDFQKQVRGLHFDQTVVLQMATEPIHIHSFYFQCSCSLAKDDPHTMKPSTSRPPPGRGGLTSGG